MKVIGYEYALAALQYDLPVQTKQVLQLDLKRLILLDVLIQINELAMQFQQPAVQNELFLFEVVDPTVSIVHVGIECSLQRIHKLLLRQQWDWHSVILRFIGANVLDGELEFLNGRIRQVL